MKSSCPESKVAELLQVRLPEKEGVDLEELIRLLPIPIHRTTLWPYLRTLCGCCCSCGCSCSCGCGHAKHPGPAPSPGVAITFTVRIRQQIIWASLAVFADFNWAATGAPGLTVSIEVKSSVTYPTWTIILAGQPPVDLATWPVVGVPGETFHFRAVALNAQGNRVAESAIVTI